ncbi:uncharacterized protein LOC127288305 [Leptopilina boulardi]|uniref:uncharacterized protein LOC127288305 n=1 Tax=Leptopilina boulardi TaxID=63433 RepID=UPI0021F5E05F|nr:uncharacterized protein LOC127288305 [Leptopilina boulardi]XP_051171651.1 uncharacterized protein LOC127288305 [Leptopilina boulardi]XP_051171652.1 uncharacterized protein LOC127288305 [Leptopilina boulardi]
MNNASIFIQQSSNFQFLSVCHYINIFGIYFYNNDLITLDERNQTIPVLNTLFEYLNKFDNEYEVKLKLLKKVLKGSDLYGGEENETLDMKYVIETYQYIISTALFSQYGNINGFLAQIINKANNVNFSALKKTVQESLSQNNISRDYCSPDDNNYKLTQLTIKKVFDDHIWPVFPQPEQEMSIMEVNYIYAMVGLKIVRSVSSDITNLTFREYVLIARELDLQDFNNQTYEMVLKLFSTPALFFYAYHQKDKFQKIDHLTQNNEFWIEAYEFLFSHISSTMLQIVQKDIINSLHYKLENKISAIKSRTFIAIDILKAYCDYENYGQVSLVVIEMYKTLYHWILKLVLPKRCLEYDLPELEQRYQDQFTSIQNMYNAIERDAIKQVIIDGELMKKMNSNATVMLAQVPTYPQRCTFCSPTPRKANDGIYLLFGIKEENKKSFYALKQDDNVLSLLKSSDNEKEFAKAVANDSSLIMEIAIFSKTLKQDNEDYRGFINRVADIKTTQFINKLKNYYYDEAIGEKFLNVIKCLIPFYSCIEDAKAGNIVESAFSCTLDVLSLLPIANLVTKYAMKLSSSFSIQYGKMHLITNTLARAGNFQKFSKLTMLNQISQIAIRTIGREIITKSFFKDLAVASLQTLDPGFEIFYHVGRFGSQVLGKLFRNMISSFKSIPSLKNSILLLKSLLKSLKQNMHLSTYRTGLVPMVLAELNDYNVVRYFYPGGLNFFGPTCVESLGTIAELRSIEEYPFQIPVIQVNSPGEISYKQFIPKNGKVINTKLQKNNDDILHRVGYLLYEMANEGYNINRIHNYHVYHNTRNQIPANENPSANVNPPAERPPTFWELAQFPVNARQNIVQQPNLQQFSNPQFQSGNTANYNYPNTPNSEFQVTLRGNVETHNFPQITNVEFVTTLRGNIAGHNFPLSMNSELPSTSTGIVKPEYNSPQSIDNNPLHSMTLKDLLNSEEKAPSIIKFLHVNSDFSKSFNPEITGSSINENLPLIADSNIPQKIRKIEDLETFPEYRHKKFDKNIPEGLTRKDLILKDSETSVQDNIHDNIQKNNAIGTLQQFVEDANPVPNKNIIRGRLMYRKSLGDAMYVKYAEFLKMLKSNGLSPLKKNREQIKFLRTSVNKLALMQLDRKFPLQVPNKLWYSEIVRGQKMIDFFANLKGKTFFFNDLTVLRNKGPDVLVPIEESMKFNSEVEVRYHITNYSPYGFVDLTHFHFEFQNDYITFNDVLFTVTDTFFTSHNKILNIELKNQDMSFNQWRNSRKQDIKNLFQEDKIVESSRMQSINRAANFMTENAPMCTFKLTKNFFSNYILNPLPISLNHVPTYDMFAEQMKNMKIVNSFGNWKIDYHRYTYDVLYKFLLDEIVDLSEAQRRINYLYDFVYLQNIEEVFANYEKIIHIKMHIRFEDYYVLYSYIRKKFHMNKDGINRFEAAINRLALRQSSNLIRPIKLYSSGMFSREMSANFLESLQKKEIIAFDQFMKFSTRRSVEEARFVNQPKTSSEIPFLMEVSLKNQVGVADVDRILNDENLSYIITSKFDFILEDIRFKRIHNQEVMILKMTDYDSPTETRMVQMARRLHELFSTETKFYSDLTLF